MHVHLGADHRGYKLKEDLKQFLKTSGHEVTDHGATAFDGQDDYVDYAQSVSQAVAKEPDSRGILICGSGHGVDIVANRFPNVRSIIGFNHDVVIQGREHEDANILSLPSDWLNPDEAKELTELFLNTQPSQEERHQRRRQKINHLQP